MLKQLSAALIYGSILCSASADDNWLFSRLSPDLQKFMVAHPAALTVLTNSFFESFSNRSVGFFYFYSTNEAEAPAAHFYPAAGGVSEVLIAVRENQHPLDQFIMLLFETLNSRNEKQVKDLFEDVYNGSVSKQVFVAEIRRLEFDKMVKTRALLIPLHFSKEEIEQSDCYHRVLNTPTDYAGYITYQQSLPGKRDPDKFYQAEYDRVRKLNPAGNRQDQLKAESEYLPPGSPPTHFGFRKGFFAKSRGFFDFSERFF